MYQIETIMLVVLGFAVALLLALILGKLLWGQAIGLGKRRSRRDNPATIASLQADKDKLRAEAAMLSRKLELRLDDLKTRLAEQTAEVSRHRNRVDRLAREIKDRDTLVVKRDEEIEQLKTQAAPLEQELVTRTQSAQQLKQKLRDKDEQLQLKSTLVESLQDQLKEALKVNTANAANAIVGQIDMAARDKLQIRISDLTDLSKQIEEQRLQLTRQHSELQNLTGVISNSKPRANAKKKSNKDAYIEQLGSSGSKIEKQLEEAERETYKLQKELARLDEDWNDKLKQLDAAKPADTQPKTVSTKADIKPDKDIGEDEQETSNVVSLASRIRSLQSDIKGQKT